MNRHERRARNAQKPRATRKAERHYAQNTARIAKAMGIDPAILQTMSGAERAAALQEAWFQSRENPSK